ncbi:hypothetical protein ACOME3_007958 [Neoechinorhynchus agilis]
MNKLISTIVKQKTAALSIFQSGIDAVNPYRVVSDALAKNSKFTNQNRLYACAFGKAAFEMMKAVDDKIGNRLNECVLSLPIGQRNQTISHKWNAPKMSIYYGAKNNVADEDSMKAAKHIYDLANDLTENDTLLVLISGGGSALLPLPADGISLRDKQKVTVCLAQRAASIQELNTVRKALSKIKGGGLLERAQPAKRQIHRQLPRNITEHLRKRAAKSLDKIKYRSEVQIVASNAMALKAASEKAIELGYSPYILTDKLTGEARQRGSQIARLLHGDRNALGEMGLEVVDHCDRRKCYLLGGETTVVVKGNGTGGRNQELALSAALQFDSDMSDDNLLVLAGGTDGIDGPTDAAGAFGYRQLIRSGGKYDEGLKALENNDAYTFLKQVDGLVFTGHTGTNVMDMVVGLSDE